MAVDISQGDCIACISHDCLMSITLSSRAVIDVNPRRPDPRMPREALATRNLPRIYPRNSIIKSTATDFHMTSTLAIRCAHQGLDFAD